MSSGMRRAVLTLACGLGGCAVMPDIAPDWALPMREIMLHSACELQDALGALDHEVPPELFNARNWKIAITLNPKSEADIVPGAGLTRRGPANTATRFSNWVVGGSNGVTLDMRGNRAGSVDFNFDSEKLILDRRGYLVSGKPFPIMRSPRIWPSRTGSTVPSRPLPWRARPSIIQSSQPRWWSSSTAAPATPTHSR
ncbi:hypothetical protein ACVW04_006382 [Bradyrhizobium sp. LM2.3]